MPKHTQKKPFSHNPFRNKGGDNGGKTPRKKLEWNNLDEIKSGNIKADINGAETQNGGRLHSVRLGKVLGTDKEGKEKVSGFFNPSDFENIRNVLSEAERWIDCDREELSKKRKRKYG